MTGRGRAIVLIGFMGTGKSSTGRAIARRLNVPRFDTDELLAAEHQLPVGEVFTKVGEARFRDSETELLRQLSADVETVVVTGGGIVLRPENVEQLKRLGVVVNLTAREEIVFERISRKASRPLLRTSDPRATVSELMRLREPFYRAAADVRIDTSELSHEQVADEVIQQWNHLTMAAHA